MTNGSIHATGKQYNGLAPVQSHIDFIPTIPAIHNSISRVQHTGFFIVATSQEHAVYSQRLMVSVFEYSSISLLPNAENKRLQLLRKAYKQTKFV